MGFLKRKPHSHALPSYMGTLTGSSTYVPTPDPSAPSAISGLYPTAGYPVSPGYAASLGGYIIGCRIETTTSGTGDYYVNGTDVGTPVPPMSAIGFCLPSPHVVSVFVTPPGYGMIYRVDGSFSAVPGLYLWDGGMWYTVEPCSALENLVMSGNIHAYPMSSYASGGGYLGGLTTTAEPDIVSLYDLLNDEGRKAVALPKGHIQAVAVVAFNDSTTWHHSELTAGSKVHDWLNGTHNLSYLLISPAKSGEKGKVDCVISSELDSRNVLNTGTIPYKDIASKALSSLNPGVSPMSRQLVPVTAPESWFSDERERAISYTRVRTQVHTQAQNVKTDWTLADTVLPSTEYVLAVLDDIGKRVGDERPPEVRTKLKEAPKIETSHDDRIMRPNGEYYFPRHIGNYRDVDFLRETRRQGMNPLLFGPPGTGKTALVEAAFVGEIEILDGSGDTEVSDFVGQWYQTTDKNYAFREGPLTVALRKGHVLFVDDISTISPSVLPVLYPYMDGRNKSIINLEGGPTHVEAAKGFLVVGGHNPGALGTSAMLAEPLSSRFGIQMLVETDYDLVRSLGADGRLVKLARAMKKRLDGGQASWVPQTREMVAFIKTSNTFGEEIALRNLVACAPPDDHAALTAEVMDIYATDVESLSLGLAV